MRYKNLNVRPERRLTMQSELCGPVTMVIVHASHSNYLAH